MNEAPPAVFATHLREMATKAAWIAIAALIAGALVLTLRLAASPQSIATSTLRLSVVGNAGDDGTITEFRTLSLAELALTTDVLSEVARLGGLGTPSDEELAELRTEFAIEQKETPGFLVVTARSGDAALSVDLANAMATVLSTEVELGGNGDPESQRVTIVESATIGEATVTGGFVSALRDGIVAAMVAAILVAEGVIAVRVLRGRFSPVDPAAEIRRLSGAPVLDVRTPTIASSLLPFYVEHLRHRPILTMLQFGQEPSVDLACRLAKVSGDVNRRVLLVDGDGGRSMLHRALGQDSVPGVAEVAAGTETLRSVVRPATGGIRAGLVTAGRSLPGGPAGAALLPALNDVLRTAGADQVVISATSASSLDEVLLVAGTFADAVIVSIDPTRVGVREMRELLDALHGVRASVVAVILTEDQPQHGSAA